MAGKSVFPSRGAQMTMKARIQAATKGHDLLKKKVDALQFRFRAIAAKIIEAKILVGESIREAAFSLTQVQYFTGGIYINQMILQSVEKAHTKVVSKADNVAGVILITFNVHREGVDSYEYTGLARGGQQLAKCKEAYYKAIVALLALASLETSFKLLDQMIVSIKQRVNALEFVLIPKLDATLKYIVTELFETEREDFFRIKKIQAKKQKKLKNRNKKAEGEEGHEELPCNCDNIPENLDKDLLF